MEKLLIRIKDFLVELSGLLRTLETYRDVLNVVLFPVEIFLGNFRSESFLQF